VIGQIFLRRPLCAAAFQDHDVRVEVAGSARGIAGDERCLECVHDRDRLVDGFGNSGICDGARCGANMDHRNRRDQVPDFHGRHPPARPRPMQP
jgi:hypothetical protein